MKWKASAGMREFIIKQLTSRDLITGSPVEGYYLYVYEDGKDIYDYLQDTFEIAADQAYEDFGVPKDAWQEVNE